MTRCLLVALFIPFLLRAQVSGEQLAFQRAVNAPTDSAKLAEADKFLAEYPHSSMAANAHGVKFQSYVNLRNDSAAFRSLRTYFSMIDPSQLVSALNGIAYEFAQRNYFLDSALAYIDTAIVRYERTEPVLLNTRSLVLLRMKRLAEAEALQKDVLALLPEQAAMDPRYVSFFLQMGFIQIESGRIAEGVKQIILGNLVVPKQSLPVDRIDTLLSRGGMPPFHAVFMRDSLYRHVVGEFLRMSDDSALAKSNIAVTLARAGVLTEMAQTFAEEAYASAQSRTIEERSGAAGAAGLTFYHLKNLTEAERYLKEAAAYAAPVETELFMTLGDVMEQRGRKHEAFTAYLTAAMASRSAPLYEKLVELKNELHPTGNLDSIIVAHQASLLEYTPPEYVRPPRTLKKGETDRVVLAELFTGSECKPCQAADVAFDYLIDRYRASSLAILEYHLHIPMPDPMTNEDSEQRAGYYGVRSTPSALFNGKTMITSGGNRMMAKNKFYLYADIIDREGSEPTSAKIQVTAALVNGVVTVKGSASVPSSGRDLKVRIALVEDEVLYQGANGIDRHKFVVRSMITPESGIRIPKTGTLKIDQKIAVSAVNAKLKRYFAKANKEYTDLGAPMKTELSTVDPDRLAVVAFIQDDETREVLQATTEKVSRKAPLKGKK